jgi:hypothetical protein
MYEECDSRYEMKELLPQKSLVRFAMTLERGWKRHL